MNIAGETAAPASPASHNAERLLDVAALRKYFPVRDVWQRQVGWLKALDDVSLTVRKGEILGVVGKSGCGKSTLGKTIMGIHPATDGRIIFEGNDISQPAAGQEPRLAPPPAILLSGPRRFSRSTLENPPRPAEPWSSTPTCPPTPARSVPRHPARRRPARNASRPLSARNLRRSAAPRRTRPHPHAAADARHPRRAHVRPRRLRAGYRPQSVSRSKKQFGLTYIFISHDLSVVRMICDRVAVMYLGKIVEMGEIEASFPRPSTPTRSPCWPPFRKSAGARSPTTSGWKASRPIPPTCRRAAASAPAAPSPRPAAPSPSHPSSKSAPATPTPAGSRPSRPPTLLASSLRLPAL